MGNCVMFVVNFIAFACSIPLILLARRSLNDDPAGYTSSCDRYLVPDLMVLGVFLLFVSLMWLIGLCCRMRALLWLHLFIIFISVIALVATSVSGMVAIRKGEGPIDDHDAAYRVDNFSPWLQKNVRDKELWSGYRTCLADAHYCQKRQGLTSQLTDAQFIKLFPVQWSCCQPPKHCGYEKYNATFWKVPKSGLTPDDEDCSLYSNHEDTLCYDCESCKAGILARLRRDFRWMFMFNIGLSVFLMIVSLSACSHLRQEINIASTTQRA